jgi:hypothetical protein
LSEIAHEWIYTFTADDLSELDKDAFKALSYKLGGTSDRKFEHIFMDNPVWDKPFIERAADTYFTALPHAPFTFPFRIIDALLPDGKTTSDALSDARAKALEELVFETVSMALPSATVLPSVEWKDPANGETYEHDVVAVLGNQIFIFEAKSGRIKEPARRGGPQALKKTLRELFVEPAEQSTRLQKYLNEHG